MHSWERLVEIKECIMAQNYTFVCLRVNAIYKFSPSFRFSGM